MEIDKLQNLEVNMAYSGLGERVASYLDTGEKVADKEFITGLISDSIIISNITNSGNWTADVYTGPAITVYEGQYYYDSFYKYEANADDSIIRLSVLSALWSVNGTDIYYNTGKVGVGATTFLPEINYMQLGAGASTSGSSDTAISHARLISTGTGNAHGYTDAPDISRAGTMAYASFDAKAKFIGSNNFDHYVGFQSNGNFNSSGTITNFYSFISIPAVTAGTATNVYGYYAKDHSATVGTITNNYGIYVEGLTKGVNNYGFYTAGTTKNYSGGNIEFGQVGSLAANSIGHHTNNFMYVVGGSAGLQLTDDGLNGITIIDGGNVGIGTITPTQLLSIEGTAGVSTYYKRTTNNVAMQVGTYNYGFVYTTSNHNLQLGTNGSATDLIIDTSGNILVPAVYTTQAGTANVSIASDGKLTRASSSRVLKKEIKYNVDPSHALKFKPASFKMKASNAKHLGFIAEDLDSIDERFVSGKGEGVLGLDLNAIMAAQSATIIQQQKEIKTQQGVINTQQFKVERLELEVDLIRNHLRI